MLKIKSKIILFAVLGLSLFIVAFGVGFALRGSVLFSKPDEPLITGSVIAQEIAEISELAVLRYHYTDAAKFEDFVMLNKWKVPFSKKGFILKFSGDIKLGIDVKHIQVDVDEEIKEITITLPPVKILSHVIDEHSVESWDETKNIFNQLEIGDYIAFQIDQKNSIEGSDTVEGLKEEAMEIAGNQIGALVQSFAGVKGEYTVVVVPD